MWERGWDLVWSYYRKIEKRPAVAVEYGFIGFFSAGFSIGQESEISPVFLVIRSPRVLYRVPWSNEVMAVMWLNWFYFHKRLTM